MPLRLAAVLAPGYGGSARQPLLQRLAARFAAVGVSALPITFTTGGTRPSRGYATELDDLRRARDQLLADGAQAVALVGRSFGGRMCALLAAQEPPAALVLLGYPIAPSGRTRSADAAALVRVTCPTLIVQGDRDQLGPLPVLRSIIEANPRVDLVVVPGVGHALGAAESMAVDLTSDWLAQLRTTP